MRKQKWPDSPQTETILTNLDTVREVLRICRKNGDLDKELNRLLGLLEHDLKQGIPALKDWEFEQSDALYFYPRGGWKVRGDHVKLCIGPLSPTAEGSDDETCNPYVGIYVPFKRRAREGFELLLRRRMQSGFKHIGDFPPGEYEKTVPLWRKIPYRDYIVGSRFDGDKFRS